ncbi:MAG: SMP-30/gluconolactonase/LRE family protein [Gammaproteobacteria bacterium]|nr:SMP-30/gluconolactonase/LRE family protein [Gammaproteobacteria bacterium]
MLEAKLLKRLPVQNQLGEAVVYDQRLDAIWWTDIKQATLYCYLLATETLRQWQAPSAITAIGLTSNPAQLMVSFYKGVALYQPDTGDWQVVAETEPHLPGNRLNDGRMDRQGRFWVGSMVEDPTANPPDSSGSLYCYSAATGLQKIFSGLQIANGLGFSPDSRWLYHADSPRRTIKRYAFDASSGMVTGGELWHQTPEHSYPDGATIDADGHLWSAHWGSGRVYRYLPDGRIAGHIQLDVTQSSCVALGGRQQTLLFVTSAWDGLSDLEKQQQPFAGDLFIYQVSASALPEPLFALPASSAG